MQGRENIFFNICDEAEEDQSDTIKIQLANSSEIIQIGYYHLYKYSNFVKREYHPENVNIRVTQKILELQNGQNIKDESLITFFKLLQEKNINILPDQYWDLCKLCEVFEVNPLQKILKKYFQNYSNDINFILSLMVSSNLSDDITNNCYFSIMEQNLINNINSLFENPKFGQLQISSIYRIIEKSEPDNISSDLLYSFISKAIEKRFILFKFLNLERLSDEKFDELLFNYENANDSLTKSYYNYLSNGISIIQSLKNEKKIFMAEISKLKYLNSQIQSELNEYKMMNLQLKEKQDKMEKDEADSQLLIKKYRIEAEAYSDFVFAMISKVDNIKKIDLGSNTIYYHLCQMGNVNLIQRLIYKLDDVNAKDKKGKNLLHYSCMLGKTNIVKYLLSNKHIDVNAKYESKEIEETALHIAIEKGNNEIVQLLLSSKNIDVNSKHVSKSTISWLSKKEADIKTGLYMAVEESNFDIVKLLLSHKSDVNNGLIKHSIWESMGENYEEEKEVNKPIHVAVNNRNYEIVKLLLSEPNIEINATTKDGTSPLLIAIQNKDIEIAKLLLSFPNIDVNIQNLFVENQSDAKFLAGSALHIAIDEGMIEIVRLLLKNPKINTNVKAAYDEDYAEKTPLHIAVEKGSVDIVELLLKDKNIDINEKYIKYSTWYFKYNKDRHVMHDFAREEQWKSSPNKIVQLKTALHIAIEKQNIKIMQLLLSHPKTDVNAKCTTWEDESKGKCIGCYTGSGFDPNKEYEKSEEPSLHLAVKTNNIEVAKLLLYNKKTVIDAKDINGETAFEVSNNQQIKNIINDIINNK